MSTIKIDRGFTQKIQHKGLAHLPDQPQRHPPKQTPRKRLRLLPFAVAGAVVCLAVIGVVVVSVAKHSKAPRPAVSAVQQAKAAAPVPAAAPDASDRGPVEPVEPVDLYSAPAKPQSASQPSPGKPSQPSKPILRDVPVGGAQGLLCDYYERITGKEIRLLRAATNFPALPSRTVQVKRFELSEKLGDNYGVRVRGFLTPPHSGTYRFSVCADDTAELWLSSDESPEHVRKLVALSSCVGKKWTERPEQLSEPCELVGAKRYYVEALMKQASGSDHLLVGWSGPISNSWVTIDAPYLSPWSDAPQPPRAATTLAEKRKANVEREAALAPVRAALAEQKKLNGAAYKFSDAARALKASRAAGRSAEAQALLDAAVLRYETLGTLRAFLQAELSRAPLKGVWVAFGGQADVTGASDEGITVAPGRIVDWAKVPADQMLRLVNATVPKAAAGPEAKGTLMLAAAIFCKEISGGLELALKYRERAVALNAALVPVAERALGGTPDALLAQPRIDAARAEMGRAAAAVPGLASSLASLQSNLVSVSQSIAGLNVDYWDQLSVASLDEFRKQNMAQKKSPSASQRLADFCTPDDRNEKYVARIEGFLKPPETGDYVFFIAADDQGEFWLSTDQTPENEALCVKCDAHTGKRQWDKDKRKSNPVSLEKGLRYSVKGLLREGEKSDHFAVAWSLASANSPELITSEHLICKKATGLSETARELQAKIDGDLKLAQSKLSDVRALLEEAELQEDVAEAASAARADAAQARTARAKEAVREAEEAGKRIRELLPQFQAALRPDGGKS